MLRSRHLWLSASLLVTVGTSGCGFQSPTSVCSAGTLTANVSDGSNFRLVPVTADFTIYPGGTTAVPVYVEPINNAKGNVTIGGTGLPHGVTVAPVTASIGSTVSVQVTAANDVITSCFTGALNLFTAAAPVTFSGSSGSGSSTSQAAMNVVLENTVFTPATTNLPVMTIETDAAAPIVSKDDYVDATLTIADSANSAYNYSGTMGVKGHGNTTWDMPKKPYRLNLDSKAPLLGMTSDSNWILLANYDDKAMIRNLVSYQMSKLFGMAWTPSSSFVDLYLNGEYEGVYELIEKIEVSKARLNIGSIDDTDNSGTNLTGGYLAEIDHYDGETFMFNSPNANLPIGIYDPSTPTTTQETYFTSVFDPAEASMYGANLTSSTLGWRAFWNESSLLNWFLVEELAGNQDANDRSSDYFYKPRGDAFFYRGPVWDMDVTMGNNNDGAALQSPSVPWVSTQAAWYAQLFKDPSFLADVKARWVAVRPQALTLSSFIDAQSAALTLAAQNNYSRWPTLGEKVWPNQVAEGTYQGEVDFMKTWLTQRIAYMDATYGN